MGSSNSLRLFIAESCRISEILHAAMMDTAEGSRQSTLEALQLHGSDHPGMILVGTLLMKHNYLTWSYAIKRALRAKMKLGFIDGTTLKPSVPMHILSNGFALTAW
ncbi:hypothetical protein Sango_1060200 [Sesamum angolense]|uniref:Retrotransposon Copia-like N-terminal domain-containing protein n=1 Tax=Sesamum angolense TaxID=2727404 RepID=A0AAE1X0U8_9LAMI|nr:hypothetical protein Sango_1060200 [Sesamum angolense]